MEKLTKSEARKNFWKTKTPEERSLHAKMMAENRYKDMTVDEKREAAMRMVKARKERRTIEGAKTILSQE